MLYLVALFLPGVAVMLTGSVLTGLVLCALQLTGIGWILATIVAFLIINNSYNRR